MVFKIIAYLIPFLKEMVFGKKEDQHRDTDAVRLKKKIVFAILVSSLFLNGLVLKRLYQVSLTNVSRTQQIKKYEEEKKSYEEALNRAKQLESTLNFCIAQGKK